MGTKKIPNKLKSQVLKYAKSGVEREVVIIEIMQILSAILWYEDLEIFISGIVDGMEQRDRHLSDHKE